MALAEIKKSVKWYECLFAHYSLPNHQESFKNVFLGGLACTFTLVSYLTLSIIKILKNLSFDSACPGVPCARPGPYPQPSHVL